MRFAQWPLGVAIVSDLAQRCIAKRINVRFPEIQSAQRWTGGTDFRLDVDFPIDAPMGHDSMTGRAYGEPR